MGFNVGDAVFTRNGVPGAVTGRNPGTGELTVETKGPAASEIRSRGYVNGLSPEQREQYNAIIDDAHQSHEPRERIEKLMTKVNEIKDDPRQRSLTTYINAEISHIMMTHNIEPRSYSVNEADIV